MKRSRATAAVSAMAVVTLCAIGAGAAHAAAEQLTSRTLGEVEGRAFSDGKRWAAWTPRTGTVALFDSRRARLTTLNYPNCGASDVNFGSLLLGCNNPNGPRIRDLASGKTFTPEPGTPPDFVSAFDPRHDSFGTIGRHWILGQRSSDDPKVVNRNVYLNRETGRTSLIAGWRDLDSPILAPARQTDRCSPVSGPPRRYELRFGDFYKRSPLRLRTCATGRLRRVSDCAQTCLPVAGERRGSLIFWQQGRQTLVAYDPPTGRRFTWQFPRAYGRYPPNPNVVQTSNALIVSSPLIDPPPSPGQSPPVPKSRIDIARLPR